MKRYRGQIYLGALCGGSITALYFFYFRDPSLSAALNAFEGSYLEAFRQGGLYGLVGLVFIGLLLSLGMLAYSFWKEAAFSGLLIQIAGIFSSRRRALVLGGINLILALIFLQLALNAAQQIDPLDQLFLRSGRPALLWLMFFFGLNFLLIFWHGWKGRKGTWSELVIPTAAGLASFGFLVGITSLGFGYQTLSIRGNNYDLTGYPILGYQVLMAGLAAGFIVLIFSRFLDGEEFFHVRRLKPTDLIIGASLFATAFLLWKSIPITPVMFIDQPRPPNFEFYPNSDAMIYDRTSLSMLSNGHLQSNLGLTEKVGLRPVYTVFLAGLHFLLGSGYEDIIVGQVAVFAVLPVLMYYYLSRLHSRPAGIIGGLLIIFREVNGQHLGGTVTGVHTRMLMSEYPTMIGILLFLIGAYHWMNNDDNRRIWALISGGFLGLTVLIRSEVLVILPLVVVLAFFSFREHLIKYFRDVAFLGIGLVLVVTPWVVRNKIVVGEIYINRPINYLNRIQSSLPEETHGRAHVFSPVNLAGGHLERIGFKAISLPVTKNNGLEDFSEIDQKLFREIPWGDVLDHYVNQFTQTVIYLPSYSMVLDLDYLAKGMIGKWQEYYGGAFYSPASYVKKLPYWWIQWEGKISPASMIFVAVNCLMIAWGVYGSWKKSSWKTGLPAAAYLAFITPYALIRLSGGRRIQPVDWVAVVYYCMGLVEISRVLIMFWKGDSWAPERYMKTIRRFSPSPVQSKKAFAAVFAGLLLVGISFPAAEVFAENQYASPIPEDVYRQMHAESTSPFSQKEAHLVQKFLDQGGDLLVGEAFYPRQFYPGESLGDVRGTVIGFMERGHLPRTEFYLSGSDIAWGVLVREDAPEDFPHGTKVLAVGCMERGVMDTLVAVLLPRSQGAEVKVYWRDEIPWESLGCPFREAQ